jgi:hypothetical protein
MEEGLERSYSEYAISSIGRSKVRNGTNKQIQIMNEKTISKRKLIRPEQGHRSS